MQSSKYKNEITSSQNDNQGNYPPPGDTTSSGGYGNVNVWSDKIQRGNTDTAQIAEQRSGLIDQSLNGTNLKNEVQDAKQGADVDTRREGLNLYGKSLDSSSEGQNHLASVHKESPAK
ncbi:hypothetical protein ONZ45_g10799 [Pleurotus djamor]|nr:hypothetical protein ONZ45_g10799 [Pleurotus djamor]